MKIFEKNEIYETQYDKMTKMPVERLIILLGIPTTMSMLVTNIYNVADTYFVSGLSTSASGATGIVFAVMAIIQAFGFMLGHGAGSNISRRLGSKNVEEAIVFASTSFFLSIFCGTVIMILGLLFLDPLMIFLGSTDTILPYSRQYGMFILLAAPAMASGCVMNNILRYEGKAIYAMVGLVSGAVINIFGDMFFIFYCNMGIRGAGLSTAISQYISAVILLMPFITGKTQSKFLVSKITRKFSDVKNIIHVGLPSLIRQGLGSISVMALNLSASVYGDAAIAAMSIASRVINFLFCVGLGVGQGFQPVSAFNYGARKYSRVKKGFVFTLKFGLCVLSAFAVVGFIFAGRIVEVFRNDAEVINIGMIALRAQCISLVMMPVSLCGSMLFQSIGQASKASFLACTRSGLFFIPLIIILPRILGITGLEIAQPIADFLAFLITIPMVKKFFSILPEDENI